ncbi:MAG: peptide-methionine (S)-S-oxide reductase [Veillonella sp.]
MDGGCFWGLQGYIKKISGVLSTEVGYANGSYRKSKLAKMSATIAVRRSSQRSLTMLTYSL